MEPDAASGDSPRRFAGAPFWLALGAFVLLVSVLATQHEMWRDEVRALSVAINATSLPALIGAMRVEGHPVLWYLVLAAGHAVWRSPYVMPVAAILISTVAAGIILRRSPFPVWARLLVVFGAFLVVEETVKTRNYGLGILFLVAACSVFPERVRRPIPVAAFLALTANTSVHAALAALVIGLIWSFDLSAKEGRSALLTARGAAAALIVLGGVAFALWTAHPAPEMSYAFRPGSLDPGRILSSIFTDPGRGLNGPADSNVAAAGELPFFRLGLDREAWPRWLVNVSLASIAWGLRKNLRHLAAFVVSVAGFQVMFRNVYPPSLRHEGVLFFLFVAICWLAIAQSGFTRRAIYRVTLGLLPLIALQAAAMPFMARRVIQNAESMSREYAREIRANPEYSDAILAGEPDYFMEAMPYYVSNPVYMPRQREFHHRVHFSSDGRRQLDLSLPELVGIADSVSKAKCRVVLLAIGYWGFRNRPSGVRYPRYEPTVFRWDSVSRAAFLSRGRPVFTLWGASSDESYDVYEIRPDTSSCG